jgi:hypothetical protein
MPTCPDPPVRTPVATGQPYQENIAFSHPQTQHNAAA